MLHCSYSNQQRKRPATICRRYLFVYLLIGAALYLVSCVSPAPANQPANAETGAAAPPSPLSLPEQTTFPGVRDRLGEVIRDPQGFQVKVPVPPAIFQIEQFNLDDLLRALQNDSGLDLLNPEVFTFIGRSPEELLNLPKPTTFTQIATGAQYQLIWVNPEAEVEIDFWLDHFADWSTKWLLVGFSAIYQEQTFEEIGLVKPGLYAVLLGNNDGTPIFQIFSLNGFADAKGQWTLRELPEEQKEPFTFITEREHCFSRQKHQACLNLKPFFAPDQQEQILAAIDELKSKNILPAEYVVNDKFPFVSVSGRDAVKRCEEEISAGQSENCLPNLVLAAAPTYSELIEGVVKSDLPEFDQIGIDPPLDVATVVWGVAVAVVLDVGVAGPLVTDEQQAVVNLPPGAYRFDLLLTTGGIAQVEFRNRITPVHLAQLVASDGTRYYDPVLEVPVIEGFPLVPGDARSARGNEIMLGSNYIGLCSSSDWGYGVCPTNGTRFLSYVHWCSE